MPSCSESPRQNQSTTWTEHLSKEGLNDALPAACAGTQLADSMADGSYFLGGNAKEASPPRSTRMGLFLFLWAKNLVRLRCMKRRPIMHCRWIQRLQHCWQTARKSGWRTVLFGATVSCTVVRSAVLSAGWPQLPSAGVRRLWSEDGCSSSTSRWEAI